MQDEDGHAMTHEEMDDVLQLRHDCRVIKLREILCSYIQDEALLSSVIADIEGNILEDLEEEEGELEDLDR